MSFRQSCSSLLPLSLCATMLLAQTPARNTRIDLPTSKQLLPGVPGAPQRSNSLPMAMAASPDGRYIAIVNAGYGTAESNYEQSIAIFDTSNGTLQDFPEARTDVRAAQTLYSGLEWSADGKHLYASLDSITAPEGSGSGNPSMQSAEPGTLPRTNTPVDVKTGNAIAVYSFDGGTLAPDRLIPIPLQTLAAGHTQNQLGKTALPAGKAIPLPTGLARVKGANGEEQLLVADEFSDDVLLLDTASGRILHRFDLATNSVVPAAYPITVTAAPDGTRAFVALWNGSAVAELNLRSGRVTQTLPLLPPARPTDPSSHPTALLLDPATAKLYVALTNRDAIAVVDIRRGMKLAQMLDTRLPGQELFGAEPDALALSGDGKELYAANSASNSVAVFSAGTTRSVKTEPQRATGFIPTEWYPTALAVHGEHLLIATGKGVGTGPNKVDQKPAARPNRATNNLTRRPHSYIATLLYGSVADVDLASARAELPRLTAAVAESNRMMQAQQHIAFAPAVQAKSAHPIKHVIYIIRENRTYDQVLGDLSQAGKPVGNGDPSLVMYGNDITPNLHKLALQFGVLDNFYDSGEVSGDGHVWSTAAISSDYNEKNWQQSYRGGERMYDFEGVVEEGYPLTEGIPDVNEPQSGYLWTNLARHNVSLYHMGEYISSKFCDDSGEAPRGRFKAEVIDPNLGTPQQLGETCPRNFIAKGEAVPANYGGGTSPYPWKIPLLQRNIATKPELVGHFDPLYPDFNLKFPDQLRFEQFQTNLRKWVADRNSGTDAMPAFMMLRFGNDHTAGTTPGAPTPRASIADNDLAVGRAVEAISHSPFWEDTAFFVLEDDAQNGADHVDAHRSIALAISKYARRNAAGSPAAANDAAGSQASAIQASENNAGANQPTPVVDSSFYTTVSVIRTMEDLLGVPPMNNNDAFAPMIGSLFAGAGDQPAYTADFRNRDNGLIYTMNTPQSPGAKQSSKMDFTHEDRADSRKLNAILWRDARGDAPLPDSIKHPKGTKKDDDDE